MGTYVCTVLATKLLTYYVARNPWRILLDVYQPIYEIKYDFVAACWN